MADLVDFVRARLDDDEAAAHDAWPSPWLLDDEEYGIVSPEEDGAVDIASAIVCSSNQQRATNRHIARHQPARVLADVEAKRELLATDDTPFCTSGCWRPDQTPKDPDSGWTVEIPHHYDCTAYYIAQVLALPYAGHPDYQEEWRP